MTPRLDATMAFGAKKVRKVRGMQERAVVVKGSTSWRVDHGDAYDLLGALPSDSVDLVITSPPYWGHRSYGQEHNWQILRDWVAASDRNAASCPSYQWYRDHGGVLGLEPLPDWYVQHVAEILDAAQTCLKAGGSMWINVGDTYFARWASMREDGRQGLSGNARNRRRVPMGGYRQEKQLLLIPARFAIAMQERRWILRNDLIWHKPNVPPRPESDRLRLAHEHFFHFVKRPKMGRAKYYYAISEVEAGANDVLTYNVRAGQDGHSATFPAGLIRPRILSSCPPGGARRRSVLRDRPGPVRCGRIGAPRHRIRHFGPVHSLGAIRAPEARWLRKSLDRRRPPIRQRRTTSASGLGIASTPASPIPDKP